MYILYIPYFISLAIYYAYNKKKLNLLNTNLKVAVFGIFYSMNPTHLGPWLKGTNMVLLKGSFSRRYLQNKWLRGDKHCAELDSAPTNTVRSQTPLWLTLSGVINLIFENPKLIYTARSQTLRWLKLHELDFVLTNTAQSQTPCQLTLGRVNNIFGGFKHLHLQGIYLSYLDFSNYFWYFLKIQNWLTLHGVRLCAG